MKWSLLSAFFVHFYDLINTTLPTPWNPLPITADASTAASLWATVQRHTEPMNEPHKTLQDLISCAAFTLTGPNTTLTTSLKRAKGRWTLPEAFPRARLGKRRCRCRQAGWLAHCASSPTTCTHHADTNADCKSSGAGVRSQPVPSGAKGCNGLVQGSKVSSGMLGGKRDAPLSGN